jgi:hypothetical protein
MRDSLQNGCEVDGSNEIYKITCAIFQVILPNSASQGPDEVGFEPTKGFKPLAVFKTAALSRSATHPSGGLAYLGTICHSSRRFHG